MFDCLKKKKVHKKEIAKPKEEVSKMEWRDRVIHIARKELGTKEIAGKENNPRILEYHATCSKSNNTDEIAWCSAFINWVFLIAGLPRTGSAAAQSWKNWGKSSKKNPKAGDVVVFGRKNSWRGHVCIYIDQSPLKVKVLGGNQGNKVCYKWYYKWTPRNKVLDIRTME